MTKNGKSIDEIKQYTLKAVPTQEVTLLLSGGLSPILLVPCEADSKDVDFTYLIQPVRLN